MQGEGPGFGDLEAYKRLQRQLFDSDREMISNGGLQLRYQCLHCQSQPEFRALKPPRTSKPQGLLAERLLKFGQFYTFQAFNALNCHSNFVDRPHTYDASGPSNV